MPISAQKFSTLISGRDSSWNPLSASNIKLSNFYRGGTIIPNIPYSPNNLVPTSGTINIAKLNGCWRFFVENSTLSVGGAVGYVTVGKSTVAEYYYGFSEISNPFTGFAGVFGGLTNRVYTTPTGVYIISSLYTKIDWASNRYVELILRRQDNSNYVSNDDISFVALTSPTFPNLSTRSSAIIYTNTNWSNIYFSKWTWNAGTVPTSGNYSIDRRFYG